MTIRLILDRSALLSFAGGALGVGETIAEVCDEGGRYGTPVTVYAAAMRRLGPAPDLEHMERLAALLMSAPAAEVLPVPAATADALVFWSRRFGDVDAAACVTAMLARPGCYLLTADPDLYVGELGDGPVIPIED